MMAGHRVAEASEGDGKAAGDGDQHPESGGCGRRIRVGVVVQNVARALGFQ